MNIDHTVDFITTLEPDETYEHYFSGIHPDGRRIQAYGTLETMLPRLVERNEQGFGIFTTPNRLTKVIDARGARRKASQVNKVRAVFADWDNALVIPPDVFPLAPSMVVRTSPGKYHFYWLVDDFPLDKFESAQRGIAKTLDTDPSVVDLSREMRLPGLDHTKGKPTLVALLECHPTRRYGADEILGAFPYVGNPARTSAPWDGTVRTKAMQTAAIIAHNFPAREDGAFNIRCPWSDQHTTPSTPTSTIYYPPNEKYGGAGFFDCKHAHCRERTAADLDAWIAERVATFLS